MPHPTGHGHIRAASFPVIGNEVFDGCLRTVRQMGDERGKAAVQAANPTKKTLLPLKNG